MARKDVSTTIDDVLAAQPSLTGEDVHACLACAAEITRERGTTEVALEAGAVIGFATVAPSAIEVQAPAPARRKGLPGCPLPVLRLARLAVDRRAQGRGVGLLLFRTVFLLARKLADDLGCVGVVVDAKLEAVAFYARYGFTAFGVAAGELGDRPAPRTMFLELRGPPRATSFHPRDAAGRAWRGFRLRIALEAGDRAEHVGGDQAILERGETDADGPQPLGLECRGAVVSVSYGSARIPSRPGWIVATMRSETSDNVTQARPATSVPPLESGDRLSRAEFERRYEAMRGGRKAELIDGVVYVSSPVSIRHSRPDGRLHSWLGVYQLSTPGTDFLPNATLRLDDANEPQPDALLRVLPEAGGISRTDADGYVQGAVELVAEVASSRASADLDGKLEVYRRHGCLEYLVVVVHEAELLWLALRDGAYVPLAPDEKGVLRSSVFPGLWLAAEALLAGDGARVLDAARAGLASSEHAAFAARLRAATRG